MNIFSCFFSLFLLSIVSNVFSVESSRLVTVKIICERVRCGVDGAYKEEKFIVIEDKETRARLHREALSSLSTHDPQVSLKDLYEVGVSIPEDEWHTVPPFCKPFYIPPSRPGENYYLALGGFLVSYDNKTHSALSPQQAAQEELRRDQEVRMGGDCCPVLYKCVSPVHVE